MSHVRNAWYAACWTDELKAALPKGISILGEPILLWRNASGTLTALKDRCLHRLVPLSSGRCEDENLRRMYHGLRYDRLGELLEIPGRRKSRNSAGYVPTH